MIFTTNLLITGIWTGLIATIVMTIFMLIGIKTGMAPMNLILMLGRKMLGEQAEENKAKKVGMVIHFMIGTSIALVYQVVVANTWYLTELSISSALEFTLIPWIIMMVMMMPMMGMGLFGLKKSPMVMVMTFMLHLIYGASLGYLVSL